MNKIFTIAIAAIVLSGCVSRLGDFTLLTTKNMDVKRTVHDVDSSKRFVGEDSVIHFGIAFGTPNMKEAIDNAIEKDPRAVGLANVSVKSFFYGLPFFLGIGGFQVEGDPIYEKTRGR